MITPSTSTVCGYCPCTAVRPSKARYVPWKRGVHIIVATPGRLLDLMERKTVSLSTIQNVVMDEADEMLNMGFTDSINAILADVPQERNTLLFSATMSPEIARISKKYLHNAKEITIGRRNEGTSNVKHVVFTVHAKDKYAAPETHRRLLSADIRHHLLPYPQGNSGNCRQTDAGRLQCRLFAR